VYTSEGRAGKVPAGPEDLLKYGVLTGQEMARMACVRGLLALVITTNGKKRVEFLNRDLNAAINIRRCAVMEKRPAALTRENFVGEPLKVELYLKKLKLEVGGRSKKAERRHRMDVHLRSMVMIHICCTIGDRAACDSLRLREACEGCNTVLNFLLERFSGITCAVLRFTWSDECF